MAAVSARRPWWDRLVLSARRATVRARGPLSARVDPLESRRLLAGDVIISEFMAINGTTLADEDGEFSDWIELHNTTAAPISLDGWYLTDNAANLDKWRFPAVTLPAGGYLIVFASNKDRTVAGRPLHTDFQLDGDGEYLGLIRPDALTPEYEFAPEYPPQESDLSYGTGPSRSILTALVPAPADARVLVPDATVGAAWTAVGYDDSAWTTGPTGVGFDLALAGTTPLPREQEPNNSPGAANDASMNFVPVGAALYQLNVRGLIDVAITGDADFFSLGRLDPGDVLSIAQSAASSSRGTLSDCVLELYRAGANPAAPTYVRVSDDDGNGLDSLIHRHIVTVGDTYYARAKAYDNTLDGTYDLSVWVENAGGTPAPATGGQTPQESEPNGSAVTAVNLSAAWRPVQYRSFTAGAIAAGAAEVDYFAYPFTAGDLVTVLLDSTSGLDAAATLYDATGAAVAVDTGENSLTVPYIDDARLYAYRVPTSGTYFVAVTGANATSGSYRAEVFLSTATAPPGTSNFGGLLQTDVREPMHGVNASAYVRVPFDYNPAGAASMTLSMWYDDGFVAYLNGAEVARRNAPAGPPPFDAAALSDRPATQATVAETIDLTAFLPRLVAGRNVLALHGLNSAADDEEFLVLPKLEAATAPSVPPPSYFTRATPGAPNNDTLVNLGPQISGVAHGPHEPADDQDVVVTAKVGAASAAGVARVTLRYRVLFAGEASLPMLDDGAHGDGAAGDGVYGATIPASASMPGQMVRYAVEAADPAGATSRAPLHEAASSPEYFGFVVRNPQTAASTLPALQFFAQNMPAASTRAGTRASVYFDGEFYDNVFVRDRGGNTSDGYKFDFNPGDRFRWWPLPAPGAAVDPRHARASRVDEINVNYNSTLDETRLRATLAFDAYTLAGTPALASFPMRVERNGTFYRMASFVENPDAEYLDRVGLDGRGAMYKMAFDNPQMNSAGAFEKLTRRQDASRDDLQEFLDGIHGAAGDPVGYLYDHFDVPSFLNYWAANTIVGDNDDVQKNYLLYRDTGGDGEWQFLPWDKDLTFGKNWGIADFSFVDPQAHPFFGDAQHPKIDGPHAYNYLVDVLLGDPTIREMYLRRLRTLMDQLLQPSNTPPGQRRMEQRISQLLAQATGDAQVRAQMPGLQSQMDAIRNQYIARRRTHLYVDHGTNTSYPDHAGIPAAQAAGLPIEIAAIDYNPSSGNQDQEYIQLTNPNALAVDVSGWVLSGGVQYTLPEGVVIPAGGSVYVARDLAAFRARTTGPSGGQRLFAVGGYAGQLSARGETLTLTDRAGNPVDTYTWPGAPTAAQRALRVTEVMYHPHDAPNNTPVDESFEYIELQNISDQPLNLNGIKLTQGVNLLLGDVTLQPGAYGLAVKNRAAFTSRYGAAAAAKIVGEYPFDTLDNGGERLRVEDASGEVVLDFHIDPAWYPSTDGLGRSLTIRNAAAPIATWGDAAAWRPSGAHGGSPGAPDVAATTVGRARLFYNNSAFDGHDPAANAADDDAIAATKSSRDGTRPATFSNVSSYSNGINGFMVDIDNLLADLTAADFAVSMTAPGGAATWVAAPAPTVSRRPGAGTGESDRVTLVWPDGAIVNRWLRVTLLASAANGLTANRTFTFGSLVGETGTGAGGLAVGGADVTATRAAMSRLPAAPGSRFDHNRDGRVNVADYAIARAARSRRLPPLAPAAAGSASVFGESPIAPTNGRAHAPRRTWYERPADLLDRSA